MIIEAEKPHNTQCLNWRKIQGTLWSNSQSQTESVLTTTAVVGVCFCLRSQRLDPGSTGIRVKIPRSKNSDTEWQG